MSFIYQGELFLERSHIEPLLKEESYVQHRYHAIALDKSPGSNISKRALANFLEINNGSTIVKLGKKWYFGDPKQADTYLQPYKTG